MDGASNLDFDRSRVSVRWLSGTILTGLCGALLMGGAVFASLDGKAHFAATPERVASTVRTPGNHAPVRKSDRLPPVTEGGGARQVFRITTMTKVGEREVPRVTPLTRVSSNLALTTSELTAKIPRFNPQRAFANADSDTVATDEHPDAAAPDPEVSFVTRDLASAMQHMHVAAVTTPMDDVIRKVREAANWSDPSAPKFVLASATPGTLAYGGPDLPAADPYAPSGARITAENITLLPKTSAQATGGNAGSEHIVTVKKGDTLAGILGDLGAVPEEIKAIAAVLGDPVRDGNLKEGDKLRILLSPVKGTQRLQPVRVMLLSDQNNVEAVAALSDMGRYVSVDVQTAEAPTTEASDDDDDDEGSGVRLYQSIYETALRNHVPRSVIDKMINIYSFDVDFQRKAHVGDALEVLYTGDEQHVDPKPEVLYASLTVDGELKKYYRFVSPDDNVVDYYDESGKSARKFLVRKPVANAVMRSGFGLRKHPILGYVKMHTGVDWACPIGTPIHAAGNGVIEKAGWEGGYGKYIRIKHNYGYETAYGHMTAFARGITPGVKVHQGQVIGYVGSTGQSTGPHVHFEIIVNGRFVDPMRIKLPHGRELSGPILAQFEQERDRIDAMMNQPTRTAQAGAMP